MSKDYMLPVVFLTATLTISAIDMTMDLMEGGSLTHVTTEALVFIVSLVGVFLIVREYIRMKSKNLQLQTDLDRSRQDLLSWKNDAETYLKGLGDAIDKQMTRWHLTEAEKEIGLLLLKGFSFKEIASVRNTSERTARQQSLEIYRKSGLAGRAEFAAFFLEDLLLPPE